MAHWPNGNWTPENTTVGYVEASILCGIPMHVAIPFWREYISFQDGLEQMLKRENTPDTEIQQRLDDEYAKACERLAERARVGAASYSLKDFRPSL